MHEQRERPPTSCGRLLQRWGGGVLPQLAQLQQGPDQLLRHVHVVEHQRRHALLPLRQEGGPGQLHAREVQRGERRQRLQQRLHVDLVRQAAQVEQAQAAEALEVKVLLQRLPRHGVGQVVLLVVLAARQRGAALAVEDVAAAEQAQGHQGVLEAAQRLEAAGRHVAAVDQVLMGGGEGGG